MTTDMKLPLVASMDKVPFRDAGNGYMVSGQDDMEWVALCHDLGQAQEIAKRVNAHDALVEELKSARIALHQEGYTSTPTIDVALKLAGAA